MKLADLFTIVNRQSREPVPPWDCNPDSDDDGMLVYFSRRAAEQAAEHQAECYDLDCEPVSLERLAAMQEARP